MESATASGASKNASGGDASPFAAPQISLPKGGGAIPGGRREIYGKSCHRYRLAECSARSEPGTFGFRTTAFPQLRFGEGQWDLWHGLEPVHAVDYTPDR